MPWLVHARQFGLRSISVWGIGKYFIFSRDKSIHYFSSDAPSDQVKKPVHFKTEFDKSFMTDDIYKFLLVRA